jgi:hypothetical protein
MANTASVKASEVHVSGEKAIITSPELVDALVQDKADTVAGLSNLVAPFDATKMHVDRFGRLVVNDAAFAAALKSRLGAAHIGGAAADNSVCNGGACAAASGITAASRPAD